MRRKTNREVKEQKAKAELFKTWAEGITAILTGLATLITAIYTIFNH